MVAYFLKVSFFSLGYHSHVKTIHEYLASLSNICSTGRKGMFNYVNQHIAMQMGMAAMDSLRLYIGEQGPKHSVKQEPDEIW